MLVTNLLNGFFLLKVKFIKVPVDFIFADIYRKISLKILCGLKFAGRVCKPYNYKLF